MSYNLFLDDERSPNQVVFKAQPTSREWVIVKSFQQFVDAIKSRGIPEFVSFDHDLTEEHYREGHSHGFKYFDYRAVESSTGVDCALYLVFACGMQKRQLPIWNVHSMNAYGTMILNGILKKAEKRLKIILTRLKKEVK